MVLVRKITFVQFIVFLLLTGCALGLTTVTDSFLLLWIPAGDFRGILLILIGVIIFYIYAISLYRLFMMKFPLLPGNIPIGSKQEFIYHIHLLHFLMLFYPVMRAGFVPVPLMRLFYLGLGARLGHNSYTAGILYDPLFISVGDNTLVGEGALLVPHAIEGKNLAHHPIKLGNNVTIGAHAIVFGGVEIGDGAIVAAGSVVRKGERIGPDEIWGGVPCRKLRHKDAPTTDNRIN